MRILGKDINFAYTMRAYCQTSDYVVANPDVSAATANLHKAVYMSQAYARVNGGDAIESVDELADLPVGIYKQMLDEMREAEARDTERTVETVEKKPIKKQN